MTVEFFALAPAALDDCGRQDWEDASETQRGDYLDSLFDLAPRALAPLTAEDARRDGLHIHGVAANRLHIMLRRRALSGEGWDDLSLLEALTWNAEVRISSDALNTQGARIAPPPGSIGPGFAAVCIGNTYWDYKIFPLFKGLYPELPDQINRDRSGLINDKAAEKIIYGLRPILLERPTEIELAPMQYFKTEDQQRYRPTDDTGWDVLTKLYDLLVFSRGLHIQ